MLAFLPTTPRGSKFSTATHKRVHARRPCRYQWWYGAAARTHVQRCMYVHMHMHVCCMQRATPLHVAAIDLDVRSVLQYCRQYFVDMCPYTIFELVAMVEIRRAGGGASQLAIPEVACTFEPGLLPRMAFSTWHLFSALDDPLCIRPQVRQSLTHHDSISVWSHGHGACSGGCGQG